MTEEMVMGSMIGGLLLGLILASIVFGKDTVFGKWIPIKFFELKKFVPMGLLMFCILFSYTATRNLKDTLILNYAGGAEALQFLKLFWVLPFAVAFMMVYMKMSNKYSKEKLFYVTIIPFFLFFALFGFVIFPNADLFHMSQDTIGGLQKSFPMFKWLISTVGVWTFSLFYVLSELLGAGVLSLLFWQFANQITKTDEAKRFYPLFGIIANVGAILAGVVGAHFSKRQIGGDFADAVFYICLYVGIAGVLSVMIYKWIYANVLTDKRFYDPDELKSAKKKKKKQKVSIWESVKELLRSKYIGCIALLVICYGVSLNIIEGTYKDSVTKYFVDPAAKNAFFASYSMYAGIVTIISMLAGSYLLRTLRWFSVAIFTPMTVIIFGTLFYVFMVFGSNEGIAGIIRSWGMAPLYLAVMFGMITVLVSKSVKYGLFDPTKEMTYIPLDDESKIKGKAMVDVVGGRLGKSGGAAVQVLIFMVTGGTYSTLGVYLGSAFVIICIIWIMTVFSLSSKYESKVKQQSKGDAKQTA